MDRPFSEAEKRSLLTEVIKTSTVPIDVLLDIIRDTQIRPSFEEILPPFGRNLKACKLAFHELIATRSPNPATFYTDKQRGRPLEPATRKRQYSPEPRNIQPKPPANGGQLPPRSASTGAPPRKRGRPSNAELAARQADAATRGEVPIAPKATPKPSNYSVYGGSIPVDSLLDTNPPFEPKRREASTNPSPTEEGSAKKRGRPKKDSRSTLSPELKGTGVTDRALPGQLDRKRHVEEAKTSIDAINKEDQNLEELNQEESLIVVSHEG